MPKTKEFISSSAGSESDEPAPKKHKKSKKHEKRHEKAEAESPKKDDDASGCGGEFGYALSKMRFVAVQEYRGKKLVGIREYYETDEGEMKPGRKGISLSPDQWKKLKQHMDAIDEDLEK